MIKLLGKVPKTVTVALSGGVDSVAVTDFLSKKHTVSVAFFHHDTENSERAFKFVTEFCHEKGIGLFFGWINNKVKPKGLSQEEHWRNERYRFLESLNTTVITAHNLDDCVETYLYGALHGLPKVIPYRRNNIIRPFISTPKKDLISWCERKHISWCEDTSNIDTAYMRNYIRHELMPHVKHINPGINTVVKKIVRRQFVEEVLKTPL